MSLERHASKQLVAELTRSLGQDRVAQILQVTTARFKALSQGRGRLADEQLLAITKKTGKFWMQWGVDANQRTAMSTDDREFIAFTRRMVERCDPLADERKSSPASSRRQPTVRPGKIGSLRRAV